MKPPRRRLLLATAPGDVRGAMEAAIQAGASPGDVSGRTSATEHDRAAPDAATRELSWWAPRSRVSAITLRCVTATWAARPTHQSPSSARLPAHHAVARAAATQASGSSTAWIVSSSHHLHLARPSYTYSSAGAVPR